MGELERLRDQNDKLEQAILDLQKAFAGPSITFPVDWKLTRIETLVLRSLVSHERVTKEALYATVYQSGERDRGENVVPQVVSMMRKKLIRHGIRIHNERGQGFYLDSETRKRLM